MKKNRINLAVIFLLTVFAQIVQAQCTQKDIKVPSSFVFNSKMGGPKALILETTGIKELKLSLYTSKGMKIFESTSSIIGAASGLVKLVDTGWDGTKLGETLKAGFYVYTIEAGCTDRKNIYKTGQLVLTIPR